MNPSFGPAETRDILHACLRALAENRDHLDALDRAIGDGDHGSTMHRGAVAAMAALGGRDFSTVNAVFETIGSAMLAGMGGASGILFGLWFRAARDCPQSTALDPITVKKFLERGLRDLQEKTAAAAGDKTFMDALIPAMETLVETEDRSFQEIFRTMAAAAADGAENTIGLFPRFGRAVSLGERARAGKDPGAASISIFFHALAKEIGRRHPDS